VSSVPRTPERTGRGVVGAAESVCAMLLRQRAASASERVFGVRPEGVAGAKSPLVGGMRLGWLSCIVGVMELREVEGR
jgi:hypothetical protein